MKDILGREIKDGDMCIGMAIGRNSPGMHIGVFQGSSVVYLGYSEEYINKSCTSNTYLIENPTKKELEIRDKINIFLQKEAEERERKANLKTIPLSKLEVGGIYKSTQGEMYLYLGKKKVIFEDFDYGNTVIKEGHCFAYVYNSDYESDEKILERALEINTYRRSHSISVLKGNKKLTNIVRKVDLKFPLIKEEKQEGNWRNHGNNMKLTIE